MFTWFQLASAQERNRSTLVDPSWLLLSSPYKTPSLGSKTRRKQDKSSEFTGKCIDPPKGMLWFSPSPRCSTQVANKSRSAGRGEALRNGLPHSFREIAWSLQGARRWRAQTATFPLPSPTEKTGRRAPLQRRRGLPILASLRLCRWRLLRERLAMSHPPLHGFPGTATRGQHHRCDLRLHPRGHQVCSLPLDWLCLASNFRLSRGSL